MSEFLNRLETVRNKGLELTDKLIEYAQAFDDFYSYCVEAHAAKEKRQGNPTRIAELSQTQKRPLLSAYQRCD